MPVGSLAWSLTLVLVLASEVFASPTYEIVKSFEATAHPYEGPHLVPGLGGSLYGLTRDGGPADRGTVFRVDGGGVVTRLHAFSGPDGSYPNGLVMGPSGALYGTAGGSADVATVFKIDAGGTFSTLHVFPPYTSFPSPFTVAANHLVVLGDGTVYGIAISALEVSGLVFKIAPDGTFTQLYEFTSGNPVAIAVKSDGTLYGISNGISSPDLVFKIDPAGTFTILHAFTGGGAGGEYPTSLILAADDTLYGTTMLSQSVFRVSPAGVFTSYSLGASRPTGIALASDGTLFGTAYVGGASGGSVFKLTPAGSLSTIHDFPATRFQPYSISSSGGLFYGTVFGDGRHVFSIDSAGTYSEIASFPTIAPWQPNGAATWTPVTHDGASNFYGSGPLVVFRVETSGASSVLHSFAAADGERPSSLVVANDGALVGTTAAGGDADLGAIFRIGPGGFSRLHSLESQGELQLIRSSDGVIRSAQNGSQLKLISVATNGAVSILTLPLFGEGGLSRLTEGLDGSFFFTNGSKGMPFGQSFYVRRVTAAGGGVTLTGGDNSPCNVGDLTRGADGQVYRPCPYSVYRTTSSDSFELLGSLSDYATSLLTLGADGDLYGTAAGTVFGIGKDGNARTLHSFSGQEGSGAALTLGIDRALYGVTSLGGVSNLGTVFRIQTNGAFQSLHSFTGADGGAPTDALVRGKGYALYGVTRGVDTVFRVDAPSGFTTLRTFAAADGIGPGNLVLGSDCALYGTTESGGPGGGGVVFRLYEPGQLCANADSDSDTVVDIVDDCPTVANAIQTDTDGDGVGDACDNCRKVSNPSVAADYLVNNPWATLTGGQRDDDHDGYGNKCDADFTPAGLSVGTLDVAQYNASSGKSRVTDTCGTAGNLPCAIFDLDEGTGVSIGTPDRARLNVLVGFPPGGVTPAGSGKCATCPLTCTAGSAGSCN